MTEAPVQATLMIVDDTPANLRFLAQLLKENNYTPRLIPNGLRALASVRNNRPDLILLDIMMPEMDGYEVCAALKADETTHDIPVIFISALDEVFDKVKAFAVGGVDYITKPFQEAVVLARIETHLTLYRLQQDLAQQNQTLEEKVAARTAALSEANQSLSQEIEQRKRHQQEKDRLFDLAQEQSEQLRGMTNLLLTAQQTQRQGLSTGLEQAIRQKISLAQADVRAMEGLLPAKQADLRPYLNHIRQLLAEMTGYVQQVATDLDTPSDPEKTLNTNPFLQLSAREQQVLRLVVEGKNNPDIAEILTVSLSTVHTYLKRIRRKLDIQDVPGLVKFAQEHGLIA